MFWWFIVSLLWQQKIINYGAGVEAGLEKWVEEFGASISFDQKMAEFDLKGSIAHVIMLGETGIIVKRRSCANQRRS